MSRIREAFVARFGEEHAVSIEEAARYHLSTDHGGANAPGPDTDTFQWALLVCIDFECASKERYREEHGITIDWPAMKSWMKAEGELHEYVGEPPSYLALFAGVFNEYMPPEVTE